jgi:molybdopterin-containing oxidoreductase family iron-sulfur binding subunit
MFDLSPLREHMRTKKTKDMPRIDAAPLWRGTEDAPRRRAGTGAFRMTRRTFLKLAGAQVMMYALAGCMKPLEKIVPYVRAPENLVPGKPLYFASAVTFEGFARGVLVRNDMGRPTKIEGNPGHPDSLGATDPLTQAAIYQLYDPARSRGVAVRGGLPSSRVQFGVALRARLDALKGRRGEGLRFLSRPIISPSLDDLRQRILAAFPLARWHQYSPLRAPGSRQALADLYGRPLEPVYRIAAADVILSVESDFLARGPGSVAYARAFGDRRETRPDRIRLNRLYALESSPTLTGACADHRIVVHPSEIEPFLAGLLGILQNTGPGPAAFLDARTQRLLQALALDLQDRRGRSLAVAGPEQPAAVHRAVAQVNEVLGNTGATVVYVPSFEEFPEDYAASITALTKDLNDGLVSDLVILDGNPAYAVPADLDFAAAIGKAAFSVHLGPSYDETARRAAWHVPMADELESWGDVRAFDGTVTVRQPAVAPLYGGMTDYELCHAFLGEGEPPYDEAIRAYWQRRLGRADFAAFWRQTVRDGVMPGSAFAPVPVPGRGTAAPAAPAPGRSSWVLQIRPDPHILDGRFSGNSWLQELPKPLTKLTWGNAALIAPASAAALGLTEGDVIEITAGKETVDAPVYVLPGQAPEVLTVHLGYGRAAGVKAGFDAYRLQRLADPYQTADFTFRKKRKKQTLATTQHHGMLSGERHLLLVADLARYAGDPHFVDKLVGAPARRETLYRPDEHLKGACQWGMCIDLNRCTGCGACTIACQVENNIAVVGKKEVRRNREMHWIRVDRYFAGAPEAPEIHHQPVPCMHCEDAPCELVCPVEATSHSSEGLNEMTYNRCVGTRYCSNNCPYKVRRFNFFEYNDLSASERQGKNPDVTIRPRGVMEKCTYCLQRINRARIAAKEQRRAIRDGEAVPACQQACPTGAIVFGNLRDRTARVVAAKMSPLNYGLLVETGARPRTTYIAKIRNPNPAAG